MDIAVQLKYNYGYSWFSAEDISVKGFLYGAHDEVLEKEKLVAYFQEVQTEAEFKAKLSSANGLFSVIIQRENEVFFAVDRIRTFPLFYASDRDKLCISDSAEVAAGSSLVLSKTAVSEFLYTGFVTGKDTLLENVFQVEAGAYCCLKNGMLDASFYHLYKLNDPVLETGEVLEQKLVHIFEHTAERLLKKINGKTVLLPLSAGYDSRLIAVLLKKNNYQNVICYTYGTLSNPEVALSRKVAKQLGFPWYFIPYDEQLIKGFVGTEAFKNYYPFAANFTSGFFTQDYFAIKFLKEKKLIPVDAVVVPGHTSSSVSGVHLIKDLSRQNIVSNIIKKHFHLRKKPEGFELKIGQTLIDASPVDVFDNWNVKERLSKFINNSNRIYEFWGLEHLMPLWDKELTDFFQNLPFQFKSNKRLYKKVLSKYFFEPYQINFFIKEYPFILQKAIGAKNRVKRKLFTDPLNFKMIAREFIKDKPLAIKWNSQTMNINSIQSSWYIMKIREKVISKAPSPKQ